MMRAVTLLLIFLVFISTSRADETRPYQFGVFPYLSPVTMNNLYSPVASQLSSSLNFPVQFRTSSTFNRFLAKLRNEYYDFALIQPFWYPVAVDQHSYIPAVRMQEPFESLILVLDDSPYRTIDDLKNTTIAAPPSFVPVVHMARQALIDNDIKPGRDFSFNHFKSVDSCLQQVLIGKASACVAPPFAPAVFEKNMKVKLRTLLRSKSIPNLSLVIHPRVPEKHRQTITSAFLSWKSSPRYKQLLENMQTEGFVRIIDSEYNSVRDFIKSLKK